jgi:hypothetical protein
MTVEEMADEYVKHLRSKLCLRKKQKKELLKKTNLPFGK